MVDAKKDESKPKKEEETKDATATATTKKDEDAAAVKKLPPLVVAAKRLDTQLGGGLAEKDRALYSYINPVKVLRRWLGMASGASSSCTLDDIASAAKDLLDPEGPCKTGRDLLMSFASPAAGGGEASMDVDGEPAGEEGGDDDKAKGPTYLSMSSTREVESWLISLAVRLLIKDAATHQQAYDVSEKGIAIIYDHITTASNQLTSKSGFSSNSLFPGLARLYRFRSLVAETMADNVELLANLRQDLVKSHNMACLRRDVDSQSTLLNLMLRDYLLHDQVEQAHKMLSNSTFPDSASNNQLCRYLYNSGRIHALRLEYTKAYSSLSQSMRKAPNNTGLGFRIEVQRLLIVVQLLMGEIPERHVFFTKGMKIELAPYLHITQAVRKGDLKTFTAVVSENAPQLQTDRTYTLISRLAHQVVKAGLRKLHISYSRMSLQDVADRLGLPSATSAEFVVAKAVRDGVLDATIHHEEGYMQSHDLVDVYSTQEPAEAFHRRIAYCLTTHNDAVRAMRYPPDEYKRQLEASRGMRSKATDDKTDEEKARELEDELDDDY